MTNNIKIEQYPYQSFKEYGITQEQALLQVTRMVHEYINNTDDPEHLAHWELINNLVRFLDVKHIKP